MAFFGSFETGREIYSDPIYTVYGARKSGDATSEYAVKVFSIHQVSLEAESTTDLEPLLSDIERSPGVDGLRQSRVFGVDAQELIFPRLDFPAQGFLEAQTLVFPLLGFLAKLHD